MSVTLRSNTQTGPVSATTKGSALTHSELDSNFQAFMASDGSGSSNVTFIASGTGATAETVQGVLRYIFVSVKSFGAVGDGTTDDTTAINNAYAALPTNGGTLFFPAGTYKVTTQLDFSDSKSVVICGVSKLASQILWSAAGAGGSSGSFGAIKLTGASSGWKDIRDIAVRRSAIQGSAISNDVGICLGAGPQIVNIERNLIENFGSHGIVHHGNSASVNIRGNSIRYNKYGFAVYAQGDIAQVENLLIDGNSIAANDGGIRVGSSTGTSITNNDVESPTATSPMLQCDANGSNVWCFGNTFGLNAGATATDVVKITGQNVTILGGSVAQGVINTNGIHVLNGATGCVFDAVQLSALGSGAGTGVAFKIDSGVTNTQIRNPNYANTWSANVSDAGTGTSVFTGNTIASPTFTGTTTLAAANFSGTVNLNGTTNLALSGVVAAGNYQFSVGRASSGDQVAFNGLTAGNGAQIIGFNAAQTDYMPLAMIFNGLALHNRTGVGTETTIATIGPGFQIGSPTGGDKGSGTINAATGYYLNNSLLIGAKDTTISTGVGSIKMKTTNPATNAAWLPMTASDGTVYWIPAFTTNAP